MASKSGGEKTIRVLFLGEGDVTDILMARSEGGRKHDVGLAERTKTKSDGLIRLEVQHENRSSIAELAQSLTADPPTRRFCADIAILSLHPDVFVDDESHEPSFLSSAESVVEALQSNDIHVLWLNACTSDPLRTASNYHAIPEPFTRKAQRLDLDLLKLSVSHGISVIDADRLLGELGTADYVNGPLDYSPSACEALCEETLRIIDDYGFFESRPALEQVGQRARKS